ncbi:hypothetical protein [Sphingomonas sp. AX6]|uniref:hypothetical protein n=1 Tax=Sphingomonas sp. AX6 TaxID=2653171 RepID=UPI0012F1288C|nr:hypothetical protein [Sphingomonas sp. AX6]VXC69953.1 conserved membrane hypothetical protein [Sphingomonas sp. AX6]
MIHVVPPVSAIRSAWIRDALLALVVAAALSASWAVSDWQDLRWLSLPDTDDMMRLAQVRDWLGGQAFHDLRQYRIAPPEGSPMHWSRLNDLGVAALILVGDLFVDRPAAELFAVIAYPLVLFFLYLLLSGRIARLMWSPRAAPAAIILAAIAAPATQLFSPGRIDHHALQVITVQCVALYLLHRPRFLSGLAVGVAAAASMGVGLETAPQIGMLIAVAGLFWLIDGSRERARLAGIGVGFFGATALLVLLMRPIYWSTAYCDGFTPASSSAALAIGLAAMGLALATHRLSTVWHRGLAGAGVAIALIAFVFIAYPTCLRGPYGTVSTFLIENYIPNIREAKSVFALRPWPSIVANGGLMIAAAITSLWVMVRFPRRWRRWSPIVAVVLISGAITSVQLRGIYIGLPLSAALLAGLVTAARRVRHFRLLAVLAAWMVSAGIGYTLLAGSLDRIRSSGAARATVEVRGCKQGSAWRAIDGYPAGIMFTSTNHAAYVVGATRHATVGAGYHRNDVANMDTYRFFLGPIEQAPTIARRWDARYVLYCPNDFREAGLTKRYPDSIAGMLGRGMTPPGLVRLPLRDTRFHLYRITP